VGEIVQNWGANVIRLPFNQEWCLNGRTGHSAEEYLASIDQMISWAAALGAYTILDLQWLDVETVYGLTRDENGVMRENHVPPTPKTPTIRLWTTLAERYQNEPAVLFDLLNEPHDRLTDDVHPIHLVDADGQIVDSDQSIVGPEEWVPWATRLVAEVRAIKPNGIIFVGGVDWAFDLRQIRIDVPNVVYSAHIYPNRDPGDWWKAISGCNEVPVFVGEWGGTDGDLEFGHRLAGLMRQLGLGWTAWSWADYPHLVRPPRAPKFEPTSFGQLVRNELGD
jgi:aryl-phospho-beta-D-glucosidase BglC (GH1 family)